MTGASLRRRSSIFLRTRISRTRVLWCNMYFSFLAQPSARAARSTRFAHRDSRTDAMVRPPPARLERVEIARASRPRASRAHRVRARSFSRADVPRAGLPQPDIDD